MLKEKPSDEFIDELPYYKTVREYICENCNLESYDVVKRSDKSRRVRCPHCNKNALESIVSAPYGRVKGQTVGSLAEQNTKKMGRYELESKRKELEENNHRVNPSTLKHTERMRKIAKLQGKQKERFLKGEIDV